MDKLEVTTEESRHGDTIYVVSYKGERVFEWHDNAQCDYPEDLCWSRLISEVFYSGVEIGKRIEKEKGENNGK